MTPLLFPLVLDQGVEAIVELMKESVAPSLTVYMG